ncbi:MAG TPA: glycosyltransferase [Streptosporangiaceae bacterium]|nr:glycosyltransferase [Streptosporangiaceae bacterium]
MTAGTLTRRGRHHRDGGLVEPPGKDHQASCAWRPRPPLAIALSVSATFFVVAQAWLEISYPVLAAFGWCTIIYAGYLLITAPMNVACRGFDLSAHAERVRNWKPPCYPDVDIYLPICGEPPAVLSDTWAGVSELVDAYPGCARAVVLDDGPSGEACELSASYGFRYLRRPDRRQSGKPGNLNFAFSRTASPLLVVFDADCRPEPDFLAQTLPYFDDPAVGIVQTPWVTRLSPRPGWAERAAVPITEQFGRVTQVCADRFSAAQCVGSSVVYRRAALAATGGFTIVAGGEDAHAVVDARRNGYRLKYLPLPLAASIRPQSLQAFARRQYRYCRGAMLLACSSGLWEVPMPALARLPYLSGWLRNLVTGLCALVLPLLPVVVLAWLPGDVRAGSAVLLGPLLLAGLVLWPLWCGRLVSPRSWPMWLACGWAQVLVVWDFARGRISRPPVEAAPRICRGAAAWNGGVGLAWVALAGWRLSQTGSWPFAVAITLGLLYLGLVARLSRPDGAAKGGAAC